MYHRTTPLTDRSCYHLSAETTSQLCNCHCGQLPWSNSALKWHGNVRVPKANAKTAWQIDLPRVSNIWMGREKSTITSAACSRPLKCWLLVQYIYIYIYVYIYMYICIYIYVYIYIYIYILPTQKHVGRKSILTFLVDGSTLKHLGRLNPSKHVWK